MSRIVIIGASSGIGAALAQRLETGGDETIAISRENRNNLSGYKYGDALNTASLPPVEGAIDGLVYCPGSINLRPFKMLKDTDFQSDMNINFMGLVNTIKAYLPNLQAADSASIVLFSTVAVQTGMPFHSSIAAAKGAVEGFGRALAAELAPKIRVNAIAPSLTDTPLAGRLLETDIKREAAKERHPMKQVGNPEDVASLVQWLLSENSAFMTGQVVPWDGGISRVKMN